MSNDETKALSAPEGAGCLPAWGEGELPAPPPYNRKNALKLIGPAAIALGTSIGSGEWLLGPAVTAKYGAALLWVATASIILQVILNQEMMRYTLATGEPIFTGVLRTKPGPKFWGPFYTILMFMQLGWPGWASGAATAIVAMYKGRVTTKADSAEIIFWGTMTFLICIAIIAFGGKIEKTLERAEWFMVAWMMIFMLVVVVGFTTWHTRGMVIGGFLGLGGRPIPERQDWMLLASFAAYAGMGGLGNGTISNWVRDKGWGMAANVGHISGLVGGRKVELSQVGKVFRLTPQNIHSFQEWMRYVKFEQCVVFGAGCFLGMALPAMMTIQFVPAGVDIMGGWASATYQAQGIGKLFGSTAWVLTLLNGFWILFSTQLGNTDIFSRTVTDMLWSSYPSLKKATNGDVRRIYFAVLVAFALFGMVAIRVAQPGLLVVVGAFIAAFNFVVLGTHTLIVQRRFLSPELRMSKGREIALVVFVLMFTAFTCIGIWSKWPDMMKALGIG